MNVLSLFDGMSCGQIALNKLGIDYDKYFACEIDKYAMQVSQHNFPDTIQLGDVQFVTKETFGNNKIDLVIGGSPCQGFSFAGKMLNFDDERSKLFFEYVRLVKELKPKYFLLENVKMKKESQDIITEYMGVEPIEINSALVSAQTRKRLYWTNIPNITQPEDKGIVLRDILQVYVDEEHFAGARLQEGYKGGNQLNPNYKSQANTIHDTDNKSGTICAGTHGYANGYIEHKPVKKTERNKRHLKDLDDKALCMTATMYKGAGNNGVTLIQVDDKLRHPEATKKGYAEASEGEGLDLTFPKSKTRRGRAMKDKSNCLTATNQEMGIVTCDMVANQGKKPIKKDIDKGSCLLARDYKGFGNQAQTGVRVVDGDNKLSWRKLTPLECERLQTVPDGYTLVMEGDKQKVSNTQRYKMLGNGWTIDVITHILKNMEL